MGELCLLLYCCYAVTPAATDVHFFLMAEMRWNVDSQQCLFTCLSDDVSPSLCFCRELVSWLSNTTTGFDALTHRVHESEARNGSRRK